MEKAERRGGDKEKGGKKESGGKVISRNNERANKASTCQALGSPAVDWIFSIPQRSLLHSASWL